MIVITLWDNGEQFAVHATDGDGKEAIDVTKDYELHPLVVEEDGRMIAGWHVGKRVEMTDAEWQDYIRSIDFDNISDDEKKRLRTIEAARNKRAQGGVVSSSVPTDDPYCCLPKEKGRYGRG